MSPESRVPENHPLRGIKWIADEVLDDMSPLFDEMYAETGRPSVAPERLLKAMVLMALYTVRSERQFCEQLDYNLLFRWFLGMNMVEQSFDASTFSKNRERLMAHQVAHVFFHRVVEQARSAKKHECRTLHGGRHPDRGVGVAEELQAEDRRRA